MDRLIDLIEVPVVGEEIEEPEGITVLATYMPDNGGLIIINERHSEFFKSRPDVYQACLAPEVGHCILCHLECSIAESPAPVLFDSSPSHPRLLHKSSWHQYGLSHKEVQALKEREKTLIRKLVKMAAVNEKARQILEQMQSKLEPLWMFRQAEHFSMCLRIPHDLLSEALEEESDLCGWRPIYHLAERFGVSASAMRLRLQKLRIIEIGQDNIPHPVQRPLQDDLFQ